jgi:GxxExxY protein
MIGAAIEVHRELGPGLLERCYVSALREELRRRGIAHASEVRLPVRYKGLELDGHLRIDLIVEHAVVVEVKSVKTIELVHEAQLLTYLRLSGIKTGLLINFNVVRLVDGIRRRKL